MEQVISASMPWSFIKKILLRFGFLFFVLYIFFNPNGVLPYFDKVYGIYIVPFHNLIRWIGKHVLHLSYDVIHPFTGSGDTTYDYLILLLLTSLSIFGCIIWTLIDHRRKSYNTLYYWLTTIVRYYVAFTMFSYGFYKIFKLQFPFPSPIGLLEPYGNSSPMHLAWSFFGYSTGYNYFTGTAEVLCGLLLVFRRTTRLGAVLSLVVAGNIMAVNYSFDVCVKLISTALVIMSLFLMLQDWKRLANFFILNRYTEPERMHVPQFRKKWISNSIAAFKYILIVFVLYQGISSTVSDLSKYGDKAPKQPLYGIYNVQTFVRNNDTLPPLTTDTSRWQKLVVSNYGRTAIQLMNDSMKAYVFKPDTLTSKIEFYSRTDTSKKSHMVYSFIGNDGLLLKGKLLDDSVIITLKKYDMNNFLLINRGFHFINETPFNK